MNSRKDKVLLIIAGLLFLGGAAFGWLKLGLAPELVRPIVLDKEASLVAIPELQDVEKKDGAKGAAYPATPRASLADNVKDWLSPEENEDSWNYDLFTTINIVWDPLLKEYVPSARKPVEVPPFGISLVKVGHPTYPYVLRSTMAGRSGKEEDREFSIENVETKQYFDRCKINKPIDPAIAIIPVSFKLVKDKDKDGFIVTRNVLKLNDKVLGQVVEIDDLKVLEFTDKIDIQLVAVDDPSKKWTLHAVGDKFTYEMAHYVVKGIDLASKTVTVDKTFVLNPKKKKDSRTTVTEVLAVPPPTPPPGKATPSATNPIK